MTYFRDLIEYHEETPLGACSRCYDVTNDGDMKPSSWPCHELRRVFGDILEPSA